MVSGALRRLTDAIWLQDSPLAQLSMVGELAHERFSSHPLGEALALRYLLVRSIRIAKDDALPERPARFLDLYIAGTPGREIANELQLKSRQHVWCKDRRQALEAMTRVFLGLDSLALGGE